MHGALVEGADARGMARQVREQAKLKATVDAPALWAVSATLAAVSAISAAVSAASVVLVFATSASPPGTPLSVPFTGAPSFTAFHAASSSFAAFRAGSSCAASHGVPFSWVPQSMLTVAGVRGYAIARS
jgi:hypothetical protein